MAEAVSARTLFAPLGPTYDRYAALLSFGQDPRWRRFLVSRIDAAPTSTVLDVATGTAAVALEVVRQKGCAVVGLDQSAEMLEVARRRVQLAAATKQVKAYGCEIISDPGVIPVKFRAPGGTVCELVPKGRYKKPGIPRKRMSRKKKR